MSDQLMQIIITLGHGRSWPINQRGCKETKWKFQMQNTSGIIRDC